MNSKRMVSVFCQTEDLDKFDALHTSIKIPREKNDTIMEENCQLRIEKSKLMSNKRGIKIISQGTTKPIKQQMPTNQTVLIRSAHKNMHHALNHSHMTEKQQ